MWFSQFPRVYIPRKLFHQYNSFLLIALNNKHFWPRLHKSTLQKLQWDEILYIYFSESFHIYSSYLLRYHCRLSLGIGPISTLHFAQPTGKID